MKVALIVPCWESIVQRPHHWARIARRLGHTVDVLSLPSARFSWRGFLRDGLQDGVCYMRRSLRETLLNRCGRPTQSYRLRIRRWDGFLRDRVFSGRFGRYDMVLYAGPPMSPMRFDFGRCLFIYDCMDDWSAFQDASQLVSASERSLASRARLILAVSPLLEEKLGASYGREKVCLVPNGCDYDFFAGHATGRPATPGAIGYTGTIGEWFDWESVRSLAVAFPQNKIILVGPLANTQPPADLARKVSLEGRRPYEDMPGYLSKFSVCIIPFRTDSAVVPSVSPIKLYEYLAAGKPVVSSPMPDVLQLEEDGVVAVARSSDEFVSATRKLIDVAGDEALVRRRQEVAQAHSWQSRWHLIEKQMAVLATPA